MTPIEQESAFKPLQGSGVGFRLNIAILCVFGCYLLATALGIYVLLDLSKGFEQLSGRHFDRAMAAAELTRDAEVIAAEVFESMIGLDRSTIDDSTLDHDLLRIYEAVRARLDANDGAQADNLALIDQLQVDYFDSLERLSARLQEESERQKRQLETVNRLVAMLDDLEWQQVPAALPGQFTTRTLQVLSYASLALSSKGNGQIQRLRLNAETALDQLRRLEPLNAAQRALLKQLEQWVPEVFASRLPDLQSERATLATARQTRLLAQRLTSSSYNYYLILRESARQASVHHQQVVNKAIAMLVGFCSVLLLFTLIALIYIRRRIVRRLHRLHAAMAAHVDGRPVTVPRQGNDEISAMGGAFDIFVTARNQAEQALHVAQQETEAANAELKRTNAQLLALSELDELTQIANRRSFEHRFASEWRRATRNQTRIGLIMADIDFFKAYNDHYGHPQGDRCLQAVAQALNGQLAREGELVARYGGEEFVILLPGADRDSAERVAGRLLEAVKRLAIPHAQSPHHIVTLSLGVAVTTPRPDANRAHLIREADIALYKAKGAGRAQVEIATASS